MSARHSIKKNTQSARSVPAGKPIAAKLQPAAKQPANLRAARRATVPDLQRQLLMACLRQPDGRLWFVKGSAETLATTYAALLSLQRKKLIAREKVADPHMMSWKITKAGKAAVAEKTPRR